MDIQGGGGYEVLIGWGEKIITSLSKKKGNGRKKGQRKGKKGKKKREKGDRKRGKRRKEYHIEK